MVLTVVTMSFGGPLYCCDGIACGGRECCKYDCSRGVCSLMA